MPENPGLMRGKRGLILGVANNRSIAWALLAPAAIKALILRSHTKVMLLKKRVEPLAEEVDGLVVGHCDVTEPASIDAVFSAVQSAWGSLDFLLHAIAFSDRAQLNDVMSTPPKTISSRLWSSAVIRSRRLPSAPRN